MKTLVITGIVLASAIAMPSAMAAAPGVGAAVGPAADAFLGDFSEAAGSVGTAIISASFVAIVWKWIKGMIFS